MTSLTIVYSTVYPDAQMASYAENVSIWWRHHDLVSVRMKLDDGSPSPTQNLHLIYNTSYTAHRYTYIYRSFEALAKAKCSEASQVQTKEGGSPYNLLFNRCSYMKATLRLASTLPFIWWRVLSILQPSGPGVSGATKVLLNNRKH